MGHVGIRGGLAAIATVLLLGISSPAQAQQAPAANPELAAKGVWNSSTAYVKDDIVTVRGSAWIAKRANTGKLPGQTSPSTAADWLLFARGFNPLGAWSNVPTYQADDLVTRLGQTWRAKRTIAAGGAAPVAGANWELFAQKGDPGPNTGIGNGTQSMPSISFSGDPDTGIFRPSAGKIALVEDGTLFLHNKGTANTALGFAALNNSTGTDNSAFGHAALIANTTGSSNAALGKSTLSSNTSGGNNTALGADAMVANTTGGANVAVGNGALGNNTTGDTNTAIGTGALFNNTTATGNTAVGFSALIANNTGTNNVAVGRDALANNTTDDSTAVGFEALKAATNPATPNVAVGKLALTANTTGVMNTAIGTDALTANTVGVENTAVGHQALANTTGDNNVGVGRAALGLNTSGSNNVAIGKGALNPNSTGSNNIAIGFQAGNNTGGSVTNSIYIGNPGASGDNGAIRIGLVNSHSSAFMAGIGGITTGESNAVPVLIDSEGQLGTQNSSRRYKYDIEAMADVSAMLSKLRPVTFRYKQSQSGQHPLQYGLIAEEVAEVFPDLAVFNKDGSAQTVKYHLLPSFLLAGYQAQQNTIDALNARDRAQTEKIEALEERLRRLEALLPQTRAAALQ